MESVAEKNLQASGLGAIQRNFPLRAKAGDSVRSPKSYEDYAGVKPRPTAPNEFFRSLLKPSLSEKIIVFQLIQLNLASFKIHPRRATCPIPDSLVNG
jgi:hypothetical protein